MTMTLPEPLVLSTTEHNITVLTLNRPAKRNALTAEMCRLLTQEIQAVTDTANELNGMPTTRIIVIRAQGPAFCAGADLGAASEHTIGGTISAGVYSDDFHEALFGMLRAIVSAPVPVIADIHGPVIGAGTQLALACDLRVAGDKAWFRVPVASLGFALDGWTIHRAQNLLGGALARNMLIANQRVTASQAAAVGFIIPVKNPAQAEEFAYEVSRLAPLAMQQLKTALNAQDATYQLSADAQVGPAPTSRKRNRPAPSGAPPSSTADDPNPASHSHDRASGDAPRLWPRKVSRNNHRPKTRKRHLDAGKHWFMGGNQEEPQAQRHEDSYLPKHHPR